MARRKGSKRIKPHHIKKALNVVKGIHRLSKKKNVRRAIKTFGKFTKGKVSVDTLISHTAGAAHDLCKGPKCHKMVKRGSKIARGISKVGKFAKKHQLFKKGFKGLRTAATAAALL